jgi:hypothetical protein
MNHAFPTAAILLALCACQSTDSRNTTPPDDALLAEVSAAQRAEVTEARVARDHAKDAYAAAQADCRKLKDFQTRAMQERDAAKVAVSRAEDAQKTAREKGSTGDVEAAQASLAKARTELEVKEATVRLHDKQAAYGRALEDLANERVKVADARVELVKARAVNTLDRPQSQKPDVRAFEERERKAQGDEKIARTKAETAEKEVKIQEASLRETEVPRER